MILVDTSIWIDHLRAGNAVLTDLLLSGRVLTHPFVIGELALGNLSQSDRVLESLLNLPRAVVATPEETVDFISSAALSGLGIGYVDASLLASTRLTPDARLWTRDKRLHAAADRLGSSATVSH
ncbi:Ribonuclease VapC32 (plasmid) [Caballeronia sp. SBC1]|uniref:type II toxin-antitoxin system VapC family toxin n=1 Tax=unclassified Caballeronia TaxID=2646786 RepID=UPI0013E17546|nr:MULTISPECIES: PIN domain-containing protein [unclassified Caballeronia]QIE26197.1 Ribonuclease VapC32 [Caballeronia sp. SBC2]QIN64490.1 Ribonuclease VapC32 [Caballeronia sp. SBC1]